jgi:hypothetical protein
MPVPMPTPAVPPPGAGTSPPAAPPPTAPLPAPPYNTSTSRQFSSLEESYLDAWHGRRTLSDVLAQIDGLGPSTGSRRRPRRNVSLINEKSTDPSEALPVVLPQRGSQAEESQD